MEWLKLFVESCVEIIHYIAWPAALLTVFLVFREELKGLIDRLIEYEGRYGIFRFSKTKKLHPSKLPEKTEVPAKLSKEARKILTTLWLRQTYHFQSDYSRRWSFRILPNADVYGVFMIGFAELLKSGLVSWTHKDGQAVLTDEGIEYIKKHTEIKESDEFYKIWDS